MKLSLLKTISSYLYSLLYFAMKVQEHCFINRALQIAVALDS